MNSNFDEMFHQGLRNIQDACFVRDSFIPIALTQARWNIVVYEAHRATELLIRGMICQMGFKPPEDHNISGLVSFLSNRLPGARDSAIPFTIGAYTEIGKGYGILLEGGELQRINLYRLENGVYTQLGASQGTHLPKEGRIDLRLEVNPPQIKVHLNNSSVLVTTDSSYNGPFTIIDRSFVTVPETAKIRILKKLGERLRKNRNPAYYSEQVYLKDDALDALSNMQESFETAKAFFSFE
jgi:HEPN domain-containing protein